MVVALCQGFLYLVLLPPWQHYDEPTHFEYAWLIADRGRLPLLNEIDTAMRREVVASMLQHRFFWNLPRPDVLSDHGVIPIGISQTHHPPVYYLLVFLPLRLVRHLDVTSQLYVARSVSLLLLLATILVAAGLMRDLTPSGHVLRWLVPLVISLMPPFIDLMTSVNNDVGAVFIFSLFLWGAIRILRRGLSWTRVLWLLSAAIAAVLTKNTAFSAFLLAPIVLLMALWRRQGWRWRWLLVSIVVLSAGVLAGILDWGYMWAGTSGQELPIRFTPGFDQLFMRYSRWSPSQMVAAILDVDRTGAFLLRTAPLGILSGFFSGFAWGHVGPSQPWLPWIFYGIALVTIVGCVKWVVSRLGIAADLRLALVFLGIAAAMVWSVSIIRPLAFAPTSPAPPTARYAFPSIIPVALVLAGGWWACWPGRFRFWGGAALLLLLFGLNVFSVWTIWSFYSSLPVS